MRHAAGGGDGASFSADDAAGVPGARNHHAPDGAQTTDRFVWDPVEPIATRPLVFHRPAAEVVSNWDKDKSCDQNISGHEDAVARRIKTEFDALYSSCVHRVGKPSVLAK